MPNGPAGMDNRPDFDLLDEQVWHSEELRAILAHQLSALVEVDLSSTMPAAEVTELTRSVHPPIHTFRDLLTHPSPPRRLLEQALYFARSAARRRGAGLPREIARTLQGACLSAMLVRLNYCDLDGDGLQVLAWTSSQDWMDPQILSLSCEGLARASAPASTTDSRALPEVDGYDILAALGEGGMGTVWRAVQRSTKREVALKLVGSIGSFKARQRFEREVELASRLEHPNVARVYDSGMSRGQCYYAMELVEGEHVDEFVRRKALSSRQILELYVPICEAVQHAHQKGIIHRDLKPSNILVMPDGTAKVLDFGLARSTEEDLGRTTLTAQGEVAGTVAFMSPEQASGRHDLADVRTDVFGLGATLYFLLTGQPPHELSGPRHDVLRRVAEEQVRRPSQFKSDIDYELESILIKALAHETEQRYVSASALAEDISRYLEGRAITARPPSIAYLMRKWLRRNRVPASITAAVMIAGILGVIYGYASVVKARNEAVAAQRDLQLKWAESLVHQADALSLANRWTDAQSRYTEANHLLAGLGQVSLSAQLGLGIADRFAPIPLDVYAGHEGKVRTARFSPDGRFIVSGGTGNCVVVWDVRTGKRRTFSGHAGPVIAVELSPDGKTIFSGSEDRTIRVWDFETGHERQRLEGNAWPVHGFASLPDNRGLASGGGDGVLRIWDVDTGAVRSATPLGAHIWTLAASNDGRHLLAGDQNGVLTCYDPVARRRLWSVRAHSGAVYGVACVPGKNLCVTAGGDGVVKVWDLRTGVTVSSCSGHTSRVECVAVAPDGRHALSGGSDKRMILWDLESATAVRTFWSHRDVIFGVAFAPDGKTALSGSWDGSIRLFNIGDESMLALPPDTASPGCVTFSPDDRLLATGHRDGTVRVWDIATRRLLRVFNSLPAAVTRLRFSPDGLWIAAAADNQRVYVWELLTGRARERVSQGDRTVPIAFLPDSSTVLTAERDRRVVAWDVKSGERRLLLNAEGDGVVRSISVSADGRRALVTCGRGQPLPLWLNVWDLRSGELHRVIKSTTSHHEAAVIEPGGARAAVAGNNYSVEIWDLDAGALSATLPGHTDFIEQLQFSGDGRTLLSAGRDEALRLWDVAAGGEVRSLERASGPRSDSRAALAVGGTAVAEIVGGSGIQLLDATRPRRIRELWAQVPEARSRLVQDGFDAVGIDVLLNWYAARGRWDWAAALLDKSPSTRPSQLSTARCFWSAERYIDTLAALERARVSREAPEHYLRLCVESVVAQRDGKSPSVHLIRDGDAPVIPQ